MLKPIRNPEFRAFIWQEAWDYLGTKTEIDHVKQHLFSVKFDTMPRLCQRLVHSLYNYRNAPSVIGPYIGQMEDILCSYDVQELYKQYSIGVNSWQKLYDRVEHEIQPTSVMNPKGMWGRFCKGVINAIAYLSRFDDISAFYDYANQHEKSIDTRLDMVNEIQASITGFGMPLACDFLKESGLQNYSKPDVHLLSLFYGLRLSRKDFTDVFQTVDLIAQETSHTPYAVDKVFWLIGSGSLYIQGIKFKTNRKRFIQDTMDKWDNLN